MKSSRRILMTLALGASAISLASCAKNVTTSVYRVASFGGASTNVSYVISSTVTDNKGFMVDAKVDAVPMLSALTRITPEKAEELGPERENKDYVKVDNVTDIDGKTRTVYYAKHIKIHDRYWTANVRDPEGPAVSLAGEEYVVYCYDEVLKGTDGEIPLEADYLKYLLADVEATDRYRLGKRPRAYYEAVVNNEITLLKEKTAEEDKKLYLEAKYTYEEEPLAPVSLPGGKVFHSETDPEWGNEAKSLCEEVVQKLRRLDFVPRVMGADKRNKDTYKVFQRQVNGKAVSCWGYNPVLQKGFEKEDYENEANWVFFESVNPKVIPATDFLAIMEGLNVAFAAGEYSSIR